MSLAFSRSLPLAVATVVLAVFCTACSGAGGSPKVASLGSTTSTVPLGGGGATETVKDYADAVAYSTCMRHDGVPNFPDPNSQGNFLTKGGMTNGQRVNFQSPDYVSANKACQHLLPNGGHSSVAQLEREMAQALKYAACMRKHGLPNLPDPVESGGNITQRLVGRPGSPAVTRAMQECRTLSP